jgi:hypothetical protein
MRSIYPRKLDGETICMMLLGVAVLAAAISVIAERNNNAKALERFEICPLCSQQVQKEQ